MRRQRIITWFCICLVSLDAAAASPPGSWVQWLVEELAAGLLHAVIFNFSGSAPRSTLAERLQQVVRHFPKTKAGIEAAPLLQALQMEIDNEPALAKTELSDAALAKLPVNEQVAYLIDRLPRQTGQQMMMPGSCDIFSHDAGMNWLSNWHPSFLPFKRQSATTPAGKLVEIGLDAVPQLIDALDDRRPTHAVGDHKPLRSRFDTHSHVASDPQVSVFRGRRPQLCATSSTPGASSSS